MPITHLPLIFGLALVLSLVLTPWVIRVLQHSRIIDIPNHRSLHTVPAPRGGGFGILLPLAIIVGLMLVVGALRFDAFTLAILIGLAGMTLIGLLDDILSLSALIRLVLEGLLMAGCLLLAPMPVSKISLPFLPLIDTGVAGWGLAWLFLIGFPNLFNFMDGINGLAGSQTLIACFVLAALGWVSGNFAIAALATIVAGGTLGFLRYNFPKARVFMGDSGSLPIGFFLAAATLGLSTTCSDIPVVVPMLVLWVFLFDAGLTLVIRTLQGRRLHHAHRQHLYQRLVVLGHSHAWVTTVYAAAMLCVATVALIYLRATDLIRLILLATVIISSIVLAALVLIAYRRCGRQCIAESCQDG